MPRDDWQIAWALVQLTKYAIFRRSRLSTTGTEPLVALLEANGITRHATTAVVSPTPATAGSSRRPAPPSEDWAECARSRRPATPFRVQSGDTVGIALTRRGFVWRGPQRLSLARGVNTLPRFRGGQAQCGKFGARVGQSHELAHAFKSRCGAAV